MDTLPVETAQERDQQQVYNKLERYLKQLLGAELQLPVNRIQSKESFDTFGIDSEMMLKILNKLDKDFGPLPKTLFFEYYTIADLTQFFLENLYEKVEKKFASREKHQLTSETGTNNVNDITVKKTVLQYCVSPVENNKDDYIKQNIKQAVSAYKADYQQQNIQYNRDKQNKQVDDIAIIGLAGTYPGSKDIYQLWSNLKEGKDCITEIPENRWNNDDYFDPEPMKFQKTILKWGGFIENVDKFDSLFFNISSNEAVYLSPQERLFLQTAHHTFEDAGYTRKTLAHNKVGVFVGVMWGQYQLLYPYVSYNTAFPVSSFASIANRVSYYYDFHGPSIAIDTMCSSSLYSLYLACESIKHGECDMALAGGVNLTIHPIKHIVISAGGFAASDGRCRSFGEGGDGYVPGEGVGSLLLKPFNKAIKDKDHIYGVVKGIGVNHGGRANGYYVPNPHYQAEVIKDALRKAVIEPESVSYIEAHGTGTKLGDPVEIAGLKKAFNNHPLKHCFIGSIKSNIGHLESAAGIAAITKVLLQFKYKQLVPSLHSKKLNPDLNIDNSPFTIQQSLEKWKRPVLEKDNEKIIYPLRAGISSFGAGGANAHVILEEFQGYPENIETEDVQQEYIITLSARNKERLLIYAKNMLEYLKDNSSSARDNGNELVKDSQTEKIKKHTLSSIAYTLQTGREALNSRLALLVSSKEELLDKLERYVQGETDIPKVLSGTIDNNEKMITLIMEGTPESKQFFTSLIENKRYNYIATLWVNGGDIDWNLLHRDNKPCKISLPVYPFEKKTYWISLKNKDFSMSFSSPPLSEQPKIAVSRSEDVETVAKEIWREHLGLDTISSNTVFHENGGNSIVAFQIVAAINKILEIDISPSVLLAAKNFQDFVLGIKKAVQDAAPVTASQKKESKDNAKKSERDETASLIKPVDRNKENIYDVILDQERFWLLNKINPGNPAYIIPSGKLIKGELNVALLKKSVRSLTKKYELLRTVFLQVEGTVKQRIKEKINSDITFVSLIDKQYTPDSEEVLTLLNEVITKPFDLEKGPLFRITVFELSKSVYIYMAAFHHIAFDGWSVDNFLNELFSTYKYLLSHDEVPVNENMIQYIDYVYHYNNALQLSLDKDLQFWNKRLKDIKEKSLFPPDYPRPKQLSYKGKYLPFEIESDVYQNLLLLCKKKHISLYIFLIAVFQCLLYKVSHEKDIIIGTPVTGRDDNALKNMIGVLSNTLVLRTEITGDISFNDLLERIKKAVYTAYDHKKVPFMKLVETIRKKNTQNFNPFFQVMFNLFPVNDFLKIEGIEFNEAGFKHDFTDYDLFLVMMENEGKRLNGFLAYSTDLYSSASALEFLKGFCLLVNQLSKDTTAKLSDLHLSDYLIHKRNWYIRNEKEQNLVVVSTFTSELIEKPLEYWMKKLDFPSHITFAPYNQVFQQLLEPNSLIHNNTEGYSILLVRVDDFVRYSNKTMTFQEKKKKCEEAMTEIITALKNTAEKLSSSLILYLLPCDSKGDKKLANFYTTLEDSFAQQVSSIKNVYFKNRQEWEALYPVKEKYDTYSDTGGHVPFTSGYFTGLATSIARAIYRLKTPQHKVIVVDCDNTLWKGICGEMQPEEIEIDPARNRFHQFLLEQKNAGMLLCMCSKNSEEDVLNVFNKRNDILLSLDDFVAWKINWNSKSQNILELAENLQLGIESFIFIDDNPVECAQVRDSIPEMTVFRFPQKPNEIDTLLRHSWVFDKTMVTYEDIKRTDMYRENMKRKKAEESSSSFAGFIQSLKLNIHVKPINNDEIPRVSQLTQRTNQFNSTTVRRTESEIKDFLANKAAKILTVTVEDRFGTYGLVGCLFYQLTEDQLILENMILSCRVLGKGIEHTLLAELGKHAKKNHLSEIVLHYLPTPKNTPVKIFFDDIKECTIHSYRENDLSYVLATGDAIQLVFNPGDQKTASISKNTIFQNKTNIHMKSDIISRIPYELWNIQTIMDQVLLEGKAENQQNIIQREYISPKGKIEKEIATIWKNILHREKIGLKDNFFDIGGSSLQLLQVGTELMNLHYEVQTVHLFQYPTVESLANFIKNGRNINRLRKKRKRGARQRELLLNQISK